MHGIQDDYEQVSHDMQHDHDFIHHQIPQRPNNFYQPADPENQNDH
jgi:hypothetical protein